MVKKVLLIDDDELFREGLSRLIDSFDTFQVTGCFNVTVFVEKFDVFFKLQYYDLIIVSLPHHELDAIELCQSYLRNLTNAPLMIFSNSCAKSLILKSIEIGASAFFTKSISPEELRGIMIELSSDTKFSDIKLHPSARQALSKEPSSSLPFTRAEQDVLRLVCEEKSSVEISDDLGISVRTVESRKRNMMKKSQSKNMIGVVMKFVRSGHILDHELW